MCSDTVIQNAVENSDDSKKNSRAPHIYLFVGSDTFSIAEKIAVWKERFAEKYNASAISVFDCEEAGTGAASRSETAPVPMFQELKKTLSSRSLFSQISLIIIRNVFSKKAALIQELLCSLLPACSAQTFVVLSDEKHDTKSELSKILILLEKRGVCSIEEFIIPAGILLKKWIANRAARYHGSFENSALACFCDILEHISINNDTVLYPLSLWQIDNEIRKLVSHAGARTIRVDDIHAIACLPLSGHVFDISDALLKRDARTAFISSHRLIGPYRSAGTAPLLRILAFLTSQFRSFCIFKGMREDGFSSVECSSALSWNPKRAWVVEKKLTPWSFASLASAYGYLLECEKRVKTGSGDPVLSFDLCIQSFLRA